MSFTTSSLKMRQECVWVLFLWPLRSQAFLFHSRINRPHALHKPYARPHYFSGRERNQAATLQAGASTVNAIAQPAITRFFSAAGSIPLYLIRTFRGMTTAQRTFTLICLGVGFVLGRIRPFWKRYTSVRDVPETTRLLMGRAVRVSDGDTFRFLHTPTPWSPTSLQPGERSSKVALPIRICSIDTPETAKFGKSGQPFGKEAKNHLQTILGGQPVYVNLLQTDQYGRGVASVYTQGIPLIGFKTFADEEMLREGLAEVYVGGGAVYGRLGKDGYLALQQQAKEDGVGIWSLKNRESAAEYKRRTKS